SRRRHTRSKRDWSSDVCSSDLFLAAQMRFVDHLADDIRREYAGDPQRTAELLSLLRQEFQARVLHITDFFVEAREEELLEQEARSEERRVGKECRSRWWPWD